MKKYIIILFLYFTSLAHGALQISVSGGEFKPIKIKLENFSGNGQAQAIKKVIVNDLTNSGLFVIDDKASQYVLSANLAQQDDKLSIAYNVKNTTSAILLNKKLTLPVNLWRYGAHKIADKIYSYLTGEKPYFTSKILFVAEKPQAQNQLAKYIAIMDQDGANIHYLTQGNHLVVTPKLSKNGDFLTYTEYVQDTPLTYLQYLKTGKRTIIGLFNNGSIAPTFSSIDPDVILSVLKENGNANLFNLNIKEAMDMLAAGRQEQPMQLPLKRLTYTNSIDAVSSFSPDGKSLVFASDRTGRQKLYTIDLDGSNLKQISRDKGSYSTPAWSPLGNYIAFTKKTAEGFSIGIMRTDGSNEHILTTSKFHSERPCWAPNGRLLMFFREIAPNLHKLYIIDIMGHKERMLNTPEGASDPDWGLYN